MNDHSNSEQAFVRALRAGDEAAFAELVRRHQRAVLRVARRYTSADVAEDVAQETWIAVLAGLRGFEQRSSLRTWILSIAARKAFEQHARERPVVALGELPGEARAETHAEALELRGRLRAAFAALPIRRRTVVALRDADGYGAAEVAQALGMTVGNVRVLLHRGRAQLASELRPYLEA